MGVLAAEDPDLALSLFRRECLLELATVVAPLGKVEPSGGDPMMTEYVVMHVLRFHRDMPAYQESQAKREWRRVPIVRPEERRIGFLGFGMMAKAPALVLQSLGFPVSAWVRTPPNRRYRPA